MPEKGKRRISREAVVREFYGIGLSVEEITTLIASQASEVRQDIARLRQKGAFANRPKKNAVFQAVLVRYAKFVRAQRTDSIDLASKEAFVCDLLALWLRTEEIIRFMEHIVDIMTELSVPGYPKWRENDIRLLSVVFSIPLRRKSASQFTDCALWWESWLIGLLAEEKNAPRSREELNRRLTSAILLRMRSDIRVNWTNEIFDPSDDFLSRLTFAERVVIIQTFGVVGQKVPTEHVKESFRVPPRDAAALRKQVLAKMGIELAPCGYDALLRKTVDGAFAELIGMLRPKDP